MEQTLSAMLAERYGTIADKANGLIEETDRIILGRPWPVTIVDCA
jgi:hypothetical protein